MYVVHVRSEQVAPTRLFLGCGRYLQETVEAVRALGIACEVEEVSAIPHRDKAELQRADRLMQLALAPAGRS